MDVVNPFLHVLVRSVVILFPLTVGWLAFRRLALSKSANAWTYAAVCLFSAVATAGILPWGLGLTTVNLPLLFLALSCPPLWISVLFIFDLSRASRYAPDPLFSSARIAAQKRAPKLVPLLLGEAEQLQPDAAVFRHQPQPETAQNTSAGRSAATTTLLNVARDIRGNATSERRRPKRLPPPEETELPFLRERRTV